MKLEQDNIHFKDEFADSPLPFTRDGSASVRIPVNYSSDGSFSDDEFSEESSTTDQNEGRLSRSLQTWMPEHILIPLEPRDKPPIEPVYSGKLGNDIIEVPKRRNTKTGKTPSYLRKKSAPIRRVASNESLTTNLSLLSCSSGETLVVIGSEPDKGKRRQKRRVESRTSSLPGKSKWEEFSKKGNGALDSLMKSQTAMRLHFDYNISGEYDNESKAFHMMDKDEQKALFNAGMSRGIKYVDKRILKRSSSVTDIKEDSQKNTHVILRRVVSASSNKSRGKPLDLAMIKRERMNRRIAMEQAQQREREQQRNKKVRKSSIHRNNKAAGATGKPSSPSPSTVFSSALSASAQSMSGHSSDLRPLSPSLKSESINEEPVTIWKGDQQILEIDLNRELTNRVKKRITKTQSALKRATGMGETNEQKQIVGTYDEFPKHTEEDFCQKPKIIQRMRISPHLSGVIHDDIRVRMGRPRYHEIKVEDLKQWDKGQKLDRANRNLKVFNWLHSLRENDFIYHTMTDIDDSMPNEDDRDNIELLHVESADEPDLKPLYRAYEVRIL